MGCPAAYASMGARPAQEARRLTRRFPLPPLGAGQRTLTAPRRGRDGAGRRRQTVRAFDAEQLGRFLASALEHEPRWWPLFRVMALAGLRVGEAVALRWDDLDAQGRKLRVERGWTRHRIQQTKTGRERTVALPGALVTDLERLHVQRKADALRAGLEPAAWLFPSPKGDHPIDELVAQRAFARARDKAGLPPHHSPHTLRHTYASLLLSAHAPIQYVQRQLGHSSISMTADVYGSWLPLGEHPAIDDLAALVTPAVTGMGGDSPQERTTVHKK